MQPRVSSCSVSVVRNMGKIVNYKLLVHTSCSHLVTKAGDSMDAIWHKTPQVIVC